MDDRWIQQPWQFYTTIFPKKNICCAGLHACVRAVLARRGVSSGRGVVVATDGVLNAARLGWSGRQVRSETLSGGVGRVGGRG